MLYKRITESRGVVKLCGLIQVMNFVSWWLVQIRSCTGYMVLHKNLASLINSTMQASGIVSMGSPMSQICGVHHDFVVALYTPGACPRQQSSWGQHGTHMGPVGPRLAPRILLSGHVFNGQSMVSEIILKDTDIICRNMSIIPVMHCTSGKSVFFFYPTITLPVHDVINNRFHHVLFEINPLNAYKYLAHPKSLWTWMISDHHKKNEVKFINQSTLNWNEKCIQPRPYIIKVFCALEHPSSQNRSRTPKRKNIFSLVSYYRPWQLIHKAHTKEWYWL